MFEWYSIWISRESEKFHIINIGVRNQQYMIWKCNKKMHTINIQKINIINAYNKKYHISIKSTIQI